MAAGIPEHEFLQMKANQITDESLESTRRMLHLVEESKEIGLRTIVALDDQGEQFERIEEDMDHIHSGMRVAEKNLKGMEKTFGFFGKSSHGKDGNHAWKGNDDVVNSQTTRVVDSRDGAGAMTGGYVQRITNDAREDEMDKDFDQVSSIIGNLKNMALDFSSEIESQNAQIDRIGMKALSNETRVVNANKTASKLLKK